MQAFLRPVAGQLLLLDFLPAFVLEHRQRIEVERRILGLLILLLLLVLLLVLIVHLLIHSCFFHASLIELGLFDVVKVRVGLVRVHVARRRHRFCHKFTCLCVNLAVTNVFPILILSNYL